MRGNAETGTANWLRSRKSMTMPENAPRAAMRLQASTQRKCSDGVPIKSSSGYGVPPDQMETAR